MRERVGAAARAVAGTLVGMLTAAMVFAQAPGPSDPLTLDAAVVRALSANPALAALRLRRAVDLAGVTLARERPNPDIHVEFTKETPTQAFGLALPIELGHKRERRVAVGEAEVRTGEAEVADVTIDVRSAVRRAYFAHAAAIARLALQDDLVGLATRARDASQLRFDAGSAPRLEPLQAQLALAQAENDLADARAEVTATRVRLNALLDWPLDAAISLATPLDGRSPPARDAAVAAAQAGSSELALLDREIEAQKLRIELARASYVPDLTPEATLTRNADPEFHTGWRAAAGVALPIFNRRRGGVQVEEAALARLTAERQAAAARIMADVAAVAVLADAAYQRSVRYRDQVLPQALEVERIAEDSYRLGQTGIAALLQALQATRDARLRSLQAAADFHNALADLERAIGAPLP